MKVIKVDGGLEFEDGTLLYSQHEQDCCELHFLDFENISIDDFDGLEFDISNGSFFERVEGYGIKLLPINGHPIPIPGYGLNNGYYSSQLKLVVETPTGERTVYDITECQDY